MSTRIGRYAALILISLGFLGVFFVVMARGNPSLQGVATEQASVDDLSVISVDSLDMLAGPTNTRALISPDGQHFAYVNRDAICIYTTAGQQEKCDDFDVMRLTPESMRWSPDGRKLVLTENFILYFKEPDVWVMDVATGKVTDITDDGVVGGTITKEVNANIDISPYWSSDSKSLTFIRYVQTGKEFSAPMLFTIPAEGGTPEKVGELPSSSATKFPTYLLVGSPDGSKIAYNVGTNKKDAPEDGVWLADPNGQNPKQILHTTREQPLSVIEFSPDGRYVLAVSKASNLTKPEQSPVRVAAVDGSSDFLLDKGNIVRVAAWAASGTGLAYLVYDVAHPDVSGLYLAAEPGKPGRLVMQGSFMAPSPSADQLAWGADNTILLSGYGGKPLNVIHLGRK